MTKVPFAEQRRSFVMQSSSQSDNQEEGQEEEVEKQEEVKGKRNNSKTTAHGQNADGMKSANVQVCSILHVAHVDVRRVTLVIVHNGLKGVEGALVVFHTFTKPFVRELLHREMFQKNTPHR